jgi:hypothetical protein
MLDEVCENSLVEVYRSLAPVAFYIRLSEEVVPFEFGKYHAGAIDLLKMNPSSSSNELTLYYYAEKIIEAIHSRMDNAGFDCGQLYNR